MTPTTKFGAVFNRFVKGFVASAIPTLVAALSGVTQFTNMSDLKAFGLSVAVPLTTGMLLAFEKAVNWVEPEQPESLSHEPEAKAARGRPRKAQS